MIPVIKEFALSELYKSTTADILLKQSEWNMNDIK